MTKFVIVALLLVLSYICLGYSYHGKRSIDDGKKEGYRKCSTRDNSNHNHSFSADRTKRDVTNLVNLIKDVKDKSPDQKMVIEKDHLNNIIKKDPETTNEKPDKSSDQKTIAKEDNKSSEEDLSSEISEEEPHIKNTVENNENNADTTIITDVVNTEEEDTIKKISVYLNKELENKSRETESHRKEVTKNKKTKEVDKKQKKNIPAELNEDIVNKTEELEAGRIKVETATEMNTLTEVTKKAKKNISGYLNAEIAVDEIKVERVNENRQLKEVSKISEKNIPAPLNEESKSSLEQVPALSKKVKSVPERKQTKAPFKESEKNVPENVHKVVKKSSPEGTAVRKEEVESVIKKNQFKSISKITETKIPAHLNEEKEDTSSSEKTAVLNEEMELLTKKTQFKENANNDKNEDKKRGDSKIQEKESHLKHRHIGCVCAVFFTRFPSSNDIPEITETFHNVACHDKITKEESCAKHCTNKVRLYFIIDEAIYCAHVLNDVHITAYLHTKTCEEGNRWSYTGQSTEIVKC